MDYSKDKQAEELGILPDPTIIDHIQWSIHRRTDNCVIYKTDNAYRLYKIKIVDDKEVLGKPIYGGNSSTIAIELMNPRTHFGSSKEDQNQEKNICSLDDPDDCMSCGS